MAVIERELTEQEKRKTLKKEVLLTGFLTRIILKADINNLCNSLDYVYNGLCGDYKNTINNEVLLKRIAQMEGRLDMVVTEARCLAAKSRKIVQMNKGHFEPKKFRTFDGFNHGCKKYPVAINNL